MEKRKRKEITCSVTITEGASERLTKALVKIHYQRKRENLELLEQERDEEMRGIAKDETA